LEFGEESSKLLVCLLKTEEFRAGVLYTVWISVGTFKDFQNFGIVVKLTDTVSYVRQDLRIGGSREAAINIGYAGERSRESVLVHDYLLVDLRNKAAEV
jgi:hypothetical protein